jgi:hypothetical protein
MKTGVANLPLHYGSTPSWLFEKMAKLAREITLVIASEWGVGKFLRKTADPYWFQSFGCVLGFDWHSSGLSTVTCGALKEGLKPLQAELGLFICGGKGSTSRKTPFEIETVGQQIGQDTSSLVYASKIAAKVDNNALQDGYQLYHHSFVFSQDGQWAVIQQGMNPQTHWARRYHWLSDDVNDFVCEPQSAIACNHQAEVLNLVAQESGQARKTTAIISRQKPKKTIKEINKLKLDRRHSVQISDVNPKNLKKIFLSTYEQQPENFEALLGMKGVGPKTIRALSLIAELIYGSPVSAKDPAKYSFAHGGKDGTPYPVDKKTYQKSIEFLRKAVKKARLGHYEKLHALRRLYAS